MSPNSSAQSPVTTLRSRNSRRVKASNRRLFAPNNIQKAGEQPNTVGTKRDTSASSTDNISREQKKSKTHDSRNSPPPPATSNARFPEISMPRHSTNPMTSRSAHRPCKQHAHIEGQHQETPAPSKASVRCTSQKTNDRSALLTSATPPPFNETVAVSHQTIRRVRFKLANLVLHASHNAS